MIRINKSWASDPEGDTLNHSATMGDNGSFPSWLTPTEQATYWDFSVSDQATAGEVEVKVSAADATNSVSDTFKIIIKDNSPVTLTGTKF